MARLRATAHGDQPKPAARLGSRLVTTSATTERLVTSTLTTMDETGRVSVNITRRHPDGLTEVFALTTGPESGVLAPVQQLETGDRPLKVDRARRKVTS